MPLEASEIVGLEEFIATKVTNMSSPDPDPNKLVMRQGDGDISARRVKADIYASGPNFAGNTLAPVEAETSNDPDDLLAKLNEVIAAVNLGRTNS